MRGVEGGGERGGQSVREVAPSRPLYAPQRLAKVRS